MPDNNEFPSYIVQLHCLYASHHNPTSLLKIITFSWLIYSCSVSIEVTKLAIDSKLAIDYMNYINQEMINCNVERMIVICRTVFTGCGRITLLAESVGSLDFDPELDEEESDIARVAVCFGET